MDERELSTDSDESDADYVPSGPESNPPSEVESEGEEEDETRSEDELETTKRRKSRSMGGKKKKKLKSSRKKEPVEDKEEEEPTEEEKLLTAEEEKKRADSLWSDFLKDTGTTDLKKSVTNGNQKELSPALKPEAFQNTQKENVVTITKFFEFAGEEVRVTKEVAADSVEARLSAAPAVSLSIPAGDKKPSNMGRGRGGLKGLSSVLGQIGKKAKLGTLEKSKLDWDRYKKDEGIEEELQRHNKGKDGYLERQDFLQRTDLRQFEIEKEMRTSRRSNR